MLSVDKTDRNLGAEPLICANNATFSCVYIRFFFLSDKLSPVYTIYSHSSSTPERLRGDVFTVRLYTNLRLPLQRKHLDTWSSDRYLSVHRRTSSINPLTAKCRIYLTQQEYCVHHLPDISGDICLDYIGTWRQEYFVSGVYN